MSLDEIVSIDISVATTGVARQGFGVPLILSQKAGDWGVERTRSYLSMLAVAADFAATDPEYLAASAMFAQTPHPKKIKMGRCANKFTQAFEIVIATLANSHTYSVTVKGLTASYTSDTDASREEIATGLASAIDAITDVLTTGDFTAAVAGSNPNKYVTVTADAANSFLAIETDEPNYLTITETEADNSITTDLDAILLYDADFYGLYCPYKSKAIITAIAAWAETNKRLYCYDTLDTECIDTSIGGGADDVMETLQDSSYHYTFGLYHPNNGEMAGAAWLGRYLPTEPGAATAKFKTLAGIPVVEMTGTHRANVLAKYGNIYVEEGGVGITIEGWAASGRFVDITRDVDWLQANMQADVFGTLVASDKIPYEDRGVSRILSAVRGRLELAVTKGVLRADPAPEASAPKVADISAADKALRNLPDVAFTGELAGAVHKVTIVGSITL